MFVVKLEGGAKWSQFRSLKPKKPKGASTKIPKQQYEKHEEGCRAGTETQGAGEEHVVSHDGLYTQAHLVPAWTTYKSH